jgi:hypothetical protein
MLDLVDEMRRASYPVDELATWMRIAGYSVDELAKHRRSVKVVP